MSSHTHTHSARHRLAPNRSASATLLNLFPFHYFPLSSLVFVVWGVIFMVAPRARLRYALASSACTAQTQKARESKEGTEHHIILDHTIAEPPNGRTTGRRRGNGEMKSPQSSGDAYIILWFSHLLPNSSFLPFFQRIHNKQREAPEKEYILI